jgi:hypothetical protein
VSALILPEGYEDHSAGRCARGRPAPSVASWTRGVTSARLANAAGSTKEQTGLAVNSWIRTSGTFDAVLDFDAMLRDPNNPTVIYAPWDHDC